MAKTENTTEKKEFVNPFEAGVSMDKFINALGTSTVSEYLKDQIKDEVDGELVSFDENDVKWLEKEIVKHTYNIKNKEKFLAQANEDHTKLILGNKTTL